MRSDKNTRVGAVVEGYQNTLVISQEDNENQPLQDVFVGKYLPGSADFV